MLKVTCTQVKPGQWQIRGEAEIDDFYDAQGNWLALKGKLEDGSRMEYRRILPPTWRRPVETDVERRRVRRLATPAGPCVTPPSCVPASSAPGVDGPR